MRLFLEAAVGALAVNAVGRVVDSPLPAGLPDWVVAGLGGGLAGPAFLRLTFVTIGKGEKQTSYGLVTFYEPLREFFEDLIDDISSEEQSRWISAEVLPTLQHAQIAPTYIGDRLKAYVRGLKRLSDTEKVAEFSLFDGILADSNASDDKKLAALVERALTLRAYRTIDNLLREARSATTHP